MSSSPYRIPASRPPPPVPGAEPAPYFVLLVLLVVVGAGSYFRGQSTAHDDEEQGHQGFVSAHGRR